MLAPARARVGEFERVARSLRESAALQFEGEMAGELPEFGAAAERELTALRGGVDTLEKLTAGANTFSARRGGERDPRSRKEDAQ